MVSKPVGSQVDDVDELACWEGRVDVDAELESSELSSIKRSKVFFLSPIWLIAVFMACEFISSLNSTSSE